MIAKSDEPVLCPKVARRAFLACLTSDDIKATYEVIRKHATATEDASPEWVRLLLDYGPGKPRQAQLVLPKVELGDLSTLEGAKEAIQRIADAQATGLLGDEEAESYRKTVSLALAALRTAAQQDQADALSDGSIVFFGRADAKPAEAAAEYQAHLEAQGREEALEN